jgi:hypothetical protein
MLCCRCCSTTGWWCYPQDLDLVRAAVRAWDPDTQDEPEGWHKRNLHVHVVPRREDDGLKLPWSKEM